MKHSIAILILALALTVSACGGPHVRVTELGAQGRYTPFATVVTNGVVVEVDDAPPGLVIKYKSQQADVTYTSPEHAQVPLKPTTDH